MTVTSIHTGNTVEMASQTCFAPATCGELVQGAIDNVDYLVNFPIDLYSTVRGRLTTDAFTGIKVTHDGVYAKVVNAVEALSRAVSFSGGIDLEILSRVPRGKGLASSSSEIASALAVASRLLAVDLSPELSCLFNASVEATDCVQAPGISLVTQLDGRVRASFAAPAGITVVMIDCGGSIDTDAFDRVKFRRIAAKNRDLHLKARSLVVHGLRNGCRKSVGLAATLSASINQKVLFKPQFSQALQLVQELGGLGINCAHSGTVLGVLLDPATCNLPNMIRRLQNTFGVEAIIGTHQLINGGIHVGNH